MSTCGQQKTPRVWKTTSNRQKSLQDTLNEVDGFCETVVGFEDVITDEMECILQPAPFVADKVRAEKDAIWNEFLRLVGVTNLTVQKKERNIKDEILASQGGTIAGKFNRYEPRKDAIEQIKEKFGIELELSYYDGEPSTNEQNEQKEGVENVISNDTNME